ncbi:MULTISPECIES: phage tail tape measure protein [unclassified Streptomyces]|uniref:phage tail tape measure protein n=1 Tax=unclassified Streptomyces TaxID=2593676 RepID=UPI0037F5C556
MAVEVGMGYVSVVPEVEGFAAELQRQVTGPADNAGQEGGQAAGEGFKSKMGGALKTGLAAIGLAAAGLLVKGFSDALDQTRIDGRIQASLGSTPQQAARYGKAAGQLYAHGVTGSVEEAASAISGVMRSGILPPDATNAQIEAITGKVANLSDVFELDLGQTSNAVGQILKNGLAKDGSEALDILTAGMQRMGPRADDMADTFNEYSTKFRDLGLSANDAMGLMSQGLAVGARDTDTMADALKEFQILATDGSESSADAYKALGLNAEEMTRKVAGGGAGAKAGLQQVLDGIKAIKDPAEKNAVAVGLFGTKAEDLGQALFAMDPRTATKALGETAGAADKMGDALHGNASASIEQFKRKLEVGLSNFIGDEVIPALMSVGSFLGETFGPAISAGRELVSGFFGVFSGPAGTQVAAFGQSLLSVGSTLRAEFMPGLQGLVSTAQTSVIPALKGLGDVFLKQLIPSAMSLYASIVSAVVPVLSALGRILLEVIWPAVMRVYASVAENLQPILAALSEFISQRAVPAVRMIGDKLREVVEKARPLIEVVTSVVSWLARLAANILGAVIPVIIRLAGPIFSGLFSALGTVIGWIGDLIGWLGSLATGIRDGARWVGEFTGTAIRKFGEFVKWMEDLPGKVKAALGDFGRLLVSQGKDLARGLWDGIQGMGEWLKKKLFSWARTYIPGPIADALGINSPSILMRTEIGRWIPPGVVEGIDDAQPALDARIRQMVTVPRIDTARVAGRVRPSRDTTGPGAWWWDELHRILADREDRREIVLRVGPQEIARAVAEGNRQISRR